LTETSLQYLEIYAHGQEPLTKGQVQFGILSPFSVPSALAGSGGIHGVLNLQCDIRKIAYNLMNKVP
jgi:hypothetical protein